MTDYIREAIRDLVLREAAIKKQRPDSQTIERATDILHQAALDAGKLPGTPAGDWVRKRIRDRKPACFKYG